MTDQTQGWLTAVVTALLILGVYLFIASRTALWDRDEPRFAQATVEMLRSGNYLYPTFEGRLRPDKPILIYWAMTLPLRVLGPTETAFRFFSCVGAAGTCFLTYLIGRRLLNSRTAWWAMVMLASTLLLVFMGTLATADGLLLFFLTGAMTVFVYALLDGWRLSHLLLLGGALGGALLTKGPVGLLPVVSMPAISWLAARLRSPHIRPGPRILLTPHQLGVLLAGGVLLSVALFLAWAIPANQATHNEFLRQGIGHHVLDRMVSPQEGHGGNSWLYLVLLPVYIPVLIAGFFPWTLHLVGGLVALFAGRLGTATTRAVLLGWIVPTFVIMSLLVTKLPHYVLPIWPALALVAASVMDASEQALLTDTCRRWLRGGVWFFAPVMLLLMLAVGVGPWLASTGDLAWAGVPIAVLLGLIGGQTLGLQLRERTRDAARVLLIGTLALYLMVWGLFLPRLEPLVKLSPRIARAVNEMTSAAAPVAVYDYDEPSLTLYLGRSSLTKLNTDTDVLWWARRRQSGTLVISREKLCAIEKKWGPLPLREIASAAGVNLNAQARTMEIVALVRVVPKG